MRVRSPRGASVQFLDIAQADVIDVFSLLNSETGGNLVYTPRIGLRGSACAQSTIRNDRSDSPLVLMESTRLEITPKADARDVLAAAIKNKRAILFVGAGISMSVGLPSWQLLVDHLIQELELDGETLNGMQFNHQMLAEYYRLKKGGIGPLRSWLDRNWKVGQDRVSKSRLHQLIVELSFPVIYTTNYDRNLETAFEVYGKPYSKISNAKSIASAIEGTTQIVKYHGDFDDDSSLVLAETDFFNRLSFDTALDIKFRADALGRTILFIGYSMSDPNIRLLLHRIWQLWEQSGYAEHRPQSFIFMSEKNVVQTVILTRWGITVLNPTSADECENELVAFLSDIQARSLRDY